MTRKAMRLYEAKGLLPAAERSDAGYRIYGPGDVELLIFIRRARALGLHLDDIAAVLAIRRGGVRPCGTVRDLLEARIAEIDTTVTDLLALRQSLVETCTTTGMSADEMPVEDTTVCTIIENAPAGTGARSA